IFLTGIVAFAFASLLCALAPSAGVLIAARGLQGIGGALLTPGSLAILEASFTAADRAKAIGAWSGLGGVATAIGPFLGGYLIDAVSWRLIFLINLPLAALVIVVALRHVPESSNPNAARTIDRAGVALVALGLAGLTYSLIEGPASGWRSPRDAVVGVLGILALIAFIVTESRRRAPMLPLAIFRSAAFSATNAVTFVIYGALGGALFLVPVQLQQVAGYSPLQAGVALLPITAIMLTLSSRSAGLAARIGPCTQMSLGPLLVAAGMLLLSRVGASSGYVSAVLPAVVVLALGLATTVAPLTATALSSAPAEHSGLASAVNNTVARSAGLLAVAVLPAAAGISGRSYLDPAAFSTGFSTAVIIAAITCALGGLLAALTIRDDPLRRTARATDSGYHCALDAPPQACQDEAVTAQPERH
ncbi:MAG: MFS transporter, partial [Sciscionella sp.]